MDLNLTGKTALVTGAAAGIGRATAEVLAVEGAVVLINGRDKESVDPVVDSIVAAGGRALPAVADVSTQDGVDTLAEVGKVDILVNNAASFAMLSWAASDTGEWIQRYHDNVVSVVRLARAFSPAMVGKGWGRIINIASGSALRPEGQPPAYAASKAAVVSLTMSLATELADTGVTVNAVSPGMVATASLIANMTAAAAAHGVEDATWENIEPTVHATMFPTLVGRLGRPSDIAALVAFLASPLSAYVNATNVHIDGGHLQLAV